ncbi:MAG: MFS transporter [Proteobacteria bacterium]|nr:MFS transporter [Pseudomonadota bacterium]
MTARQRVGAAWFTGLGGVGFFLPYFALYLSENLGFSATQVGLVMGSIPLVGIAMQPLWGQLADRTGARHRVLAGVAWGTAVGYLVLSRATDFPGVLVATLGLAVFSTSMLPLLLSVTLAHAGVRGGHVFGRLRVFGTLGFGLMALGAPFALEPLQAAAGLVPTAEVSEPGLGWLLWGAAAGAALTGALVWGLPSDAGGRERARAGEWRQLVRNAPFLRLLLLMFLAFFCIQGPMVIFPMLIRARGGDMETIGLTWLWMLLLEVPLVLTFGASLARLGARGVIAVGVAAGGARWLLTGWVADLFWIYPIQILHGVTVWGLMLGAPIYIDAVVPERLRSTAQGLLAMVGISLGATLSNVTAGWIAEHHDPWTPALVGGIGALLLAAAIPWLVPAADTDRGS